MVCVVALIEAPELRWYAPGSTALALARHVFGVGRAALNAPVSRASTRLRATSWCCSRCLRFVLFACAVAAEYLGTVFERLHAHVLVARVEAERGQEFWTALIEQLPCRRCWWTPIRCRWSAPATQCADSATTQAASRAQPVRRHPLLVSRGDPGADRRRGRRRAAERDPRRRADCASPTFASSTWRNAAVASRSWSSRTRPKHSASRRRSTPRTTPRWSSTRNGSVLALQQAGARAVSQARRRTPMPPACCRIPAAAGELVGAEPHRAPQDARGDRAAPLPSDEFGAHAARRGGAHLSSWHSARGVATRAREHRTCALPQPWFNYHEAISP